MKNNVTGILYPRNSKEYSREYSRLKRDQIYRVNKEYRVKNRTAIKVFNKQWNNAKNRFLRAQIYITLGGICKCCGEGDYRFLAIDHINGGGNEEKRKNGNSTTLLKHIIAQGIPQDKYQLLCHSCNQAKHDKKECPHKKFNVFDKSTWQIL